MAGNVFYRLVWALALVALPLAGLAAAEEAAPGDLDKSGAVDAADLVLLANYQAGNLDPLPAQYGYIVEVDRIAGALRYVPAGTFTQGSPADEPCRNDDETQFTHTLTRDLAVMVTEVTQGMWQALGAVQTTLPADPSTYSRTDRPVEKVTWYEAVLFANLLSLQQGWTRCYYSDAGFTTPIDATNYTAGNYFCDFDADGYRLLTEGEWERCCRAGTETPFWIAEPNYTTGNCASYITTPGTWPQLESAAWFCANRLDAAGSNITKPVGMKTPNPWGLCDVHGNVWEWCWDWHGTYPAGSATDHEGVPSGTNRVVRGGGWERYVYECRSAYRDYYSPGNSYSNLGFRLARSLP